MAEYDEQRTQHATYVGERDRAPAVTHVHPLIVNVTVHEVHDRMDAHERRIAVELCVRWSDAPERQAIKKEERRLPTTQRNDHLGRGERGGQDGHVPGWAKDGRRK
jgi:hypothetical protein